MTPVRTSVFYAVGSRGASGVVSLRLALAADQHSCMAPCRGQAPAPTNSPPFCPACTPTRGTHPPASSAVWPCPAGCGPGPRPPSNPSSPAASAGEQSRQHGRGRCAVCTRAVSTLQGQALHRLCPSHNPCSSRSALACASDMPLGCPELDGGGAAAPPMPSPAPPLPRPPPLLPRPPGPQQSSAGAAMPLRRQASSPDICSAARRWSSSCCGPGAAGAAPC